MDFLNHMERGTFSIRFSSFLLYRNCKRLSEFEYIEISSKSVDVTMNNKEEHSEDFYLDFVQKFGLAGEGRGCTPAAHPLSLYEPALTRAVCAP
jgi:hypothetical protein